MESFKSFFPIEQALEENSNLFEELAMKANKYKLSLLYHGHQKFEFC